MSFEYDFLSLAATIFQVLVLGVLPLAAVAIFGIYIKRILTALGEKKKLMGIVRGKKR